MKTINLKHLHLEGFKSFSAPCDASMADAAGLVLVTGTNEAEPRLGANGIGKTSLFQSLEFCLYGSPVRGLRIGDLVSWGEKRTRVSCVLEVDGEEVLVVRSGPPERVWIGEDRAENSDVVRLVGLTRRQFLNSVVFGQGAPLLIDLPIPERGDLLDEVLDLQLWMRAAEQAGKRASIVTTGISQKRVEIARSEGQLAASTEFISQTRERKKAWRVERHRRQAQAASEINRCLAAIDEATQPSAEEVEWEAKRTERVNGVINQFAAIEAELASLSDQDDAQISVADARRASAASRNLVSELIGRRGAIMQEQAQTASDLAFFEGGGDCPTCYQKISQHTADECLARFNAQKMRLDEKLASLDKQLNAAKKEAERADAVVYEAQEREKRAAVRRSRAVGLQDQLDTMEKQIEDLTAADNPLTAARQARIAELERELVGMRDRSVAVAAEENPHAAVIVRAEEELGVLEDHLDKMRREEVSLRSNLSQLEFWQQGFKRVRLFCISQVLEQLELETRNAALALGLVGWQINYATETETKSGSQKLGVQISVQSPTMRGPFGVWSGGEGQRVRLCAALGFARLLQRWAGVRWGLEIYDEPTTWLSEAGIDDLLSLLRDRADTMNLTIFLCDHRGIQHAGIARVMNVAKGSSGSYLECN